MAPADLELDQLRAFLAFAERQNFTYAARALHISQPALFAKVRRLAAGLGVALYHRRGRALELTDDGRRVATFARETLARTDHFAAQLRGEADARTVTLCAGTGAYLHLLGPGLARFRRGSDAPLRLLTRDRDATLDALFAGEADLGVVAALDDVPDGLLADELAVVGQVLALPAAHALAARRAIALADLAGVSLVVPPAGRPHRAMIESALAAAGVAWRVGVEAGGWDLMLRFASLGLGLAVVNAFCAMPDGLVARPLPALPSQRYVLLRRRGEHAADRAAELRAALLAERHAWRAVTPPPPAAPAARPRAPARSSRR